MTAAKSRLDNIDLLRALGILGVVAYHFTSRYPADYYRAEWMPAWFELGQFGVDLFFVVSGFCIYMTLERSRSAAQFWARRLARLQPAYLAAIALTFAVVAAAGLEGREVSASVALGNMVWAPLVIGGELVDGVYWSLLVEAKFYLLLGLLYFVLPGRSVAAAWAAFATLGTAWSLLSPGMVSRYVLIAPYAPAFLAGIVAYEWPRLSRKPAWALAGLTAALLVLSPRYADYPFAGVAAGAVGFVALGAPWLRVPRALTFVGLVSYPLYLVHNNVGLVIIRSLAEPVPNVLARISIATAAVFILAAVILKTVELRWYGALASRAEAVLSFRHRPRLRTRQAAS